MNPFRFLIATRNAHKVEEIRAILGHDIVYFTLGDFPGAPKVVEDAGTFPGNATKKAVELARWVSQFQISNLKSQIPNFVLADDSGLEVDALNGAPGVHSARFAAIETGGAENSSDAENNAKLLLLLKPISSERRTARFRCVIALAPVLSAEPTNASPVCAADEFELHTRIFEGSCEGRIRFEPGGTGGFGYDPLFVPDGFEQSFAELGEDVKNRLSHRARALAAMKAALRGTQGSGT